MQEPTTENKQIADYIDMFKVVNDGFTVLFARKPEREAVKILMKKYGDKLKDIINFLPKYNAQVKNQYYLVIKPTKLLEHIAYVFEYKRTIDKERIRLEHIRLSLEQEEKLQQEKKERVLTTDEQTRLERKQKMFDIIKNA